jgi:hypothetical protein
LRLRVTELFQSNEFSITRDNSMSLQYHARPGLFFRSSPLAWWWAVLTLVSGANIVAWLVLYHRLSAQPSVNPENAFAIQVMLFLSGAYVWGCAFRSLLPRADVQRICLFDTWLSSVMIGRSVATVAEVCFVVQWAMVLHQQGMMVESDAVLIAAWVIVPIIVVAECFSWYAVLTRNYLCNAIENSLWAVAFFIIGVALCLLLPETNGAVQAFIAAAIAGTVGYLIFLMTFDVPMYLKRWRAHCSNGGKLLSPLDGLRDVSTRWVVTHDLAEWREEIVWMSLYFSAAVWSSLALCVFYAAILG